MAYAAATSLYHTIHLFLMSSRISVAFSTEKLLKNARWGAQRLQQLLREYDKIKNSSEGVLAVDARIRDEARKLEDLIESEASAQFLSQSQSHGRFSLNLDHLRHDVDCFLAAVETMRAEYMEELCKPQEAAAAAALTVSSGGGNDSDDMVGFSDLFHHIRDKINGDRGRRRIAITGMAGIGKTKFVEKLFHDSLMRENFQHRAFVRVGQKYYYEFEDFLREIIAQLNINKGKIILKENEHIDDYFRNSMRGRKYLIVLDDIWDRKFENHLQDLLESRSWRDAYTQSGWILLTSRIDGKRDSSDRYRMPLLNEEESWELLQKKVFGELQDCPHQLVKAGKKIAENCEGLPLLILTVAQLLFKSPKNPEFWDKVARMQNSIFEDAMDQIYEVLLPSFHYLDQNSKACFLYMCVFPKDYVVCRSKINNLWLAEGFADGVSYVLDDIVSSNLVVIRQQNWSLDKAKACNLHVVNRHLCRREAENNKLIFILKSYVADGSSESTIENRPHLAIYHNTLLAIKEVHHSIARLSTLRSVLCTGPYHPYQVPICLELRLLRVLDALTIRFYEFPVEVVKLIQLRYLSLTTNANLPPSITKLWFLEYLIVHQHLSIINRASVAQSSYVPMEIWELEQLKHLQIIGRNLPQPRPGNRLPNLTQLLDVGVQSCAPVVLESLPKLEKLRIQIESAPDVAQTMSCFDHIYDLENIKSLGSVVVNPKLFPMTALQPRFYISNFLTSLQKLSLKGFGYSWKDMSPIARLPHLAVLKLQFYAFRGEKWEAKEMRFKRLQYLLIEDTDLVQWTRADDESFPSFSHLTMKNCHKLREFPLMKSLRQIELVDCNPLAETRAKQIVGCQVRVKYSWK